jgi:hypothetical protein
MDDFDTNSDTEHHFIFLAHITLRRLLNRVHQSIYKVSSQSNPFSHFVSSVVQRY